MRTFVNKMGQVLGFLAFSLCGFAAINYYLKPNKAIPPAPPQTYLVACFNAGNIIFSGESVGPTEIDTAGRITFFATDIGTEVRMINATCVEVLKK